MCFSHALSRMQLHDMKLDRDDHAFGETRVASGLDIRELPPHTPLNSFSSLIVHLLGRNLTSTLFDYTLAQLFIRCKGIAKGTQSTTVAGATGDAGNNEDEPEDLDTTTTRHKSYRYLLHLQPDKKKAKRLGRKLLIIPSFGHSPSLRHHPIIET